MISRSLRFGAFTLDLERLCLRGTSGQADLRPKSFEVLRYLVEHSGRVVTKEEVINAVWPNVTVTDESLTRCVSDVRRAIADQDQQIIKTVPRRGYLFDLAVSSGESAAEPTRAQQTRKPALDALKAPAEATQGDASKQAFVDGVAMGTLPSPAGNPAFAGERRQLTVLICEAVLPTELSSNVDLEHLRDAIDAYHRWVVEVAARFNGTVAKRIGNGALINFGYSAAHEDDAEHAVRAGLELCGAVAGMGRYPPPVRQSRIAIATSEVIITRGGTPEQTLVGEALNLSRRLLQVLAEPGTVVVDRTTKLLIGDLFEIRDLGAIEAAGSQTVQAWRVDANRTVESRFEGSRARLGAITAGKPRLPLPDKPSIAVLPFANLSPDPEQEYFVDGIANDLITALSRYPSLLVIARNSSFSYKGIEVNVQRIGRELGVRYALEGSVRKVDTRVRVTSQLIETESGTHIWANRYDANVNDIFAVQDEITHAVSTAIAPAVADAERHRAVRKPPDKHDSWSAYQRGLWHLSRATPEENKAAQQCFAEAIAIDANFSGGYTGLALAYLQESGLFALRTVAEARISIKALALRGVANDESDAEAHACLSWALNFDGDYEGALAEARRALTISPNLASAHRALGTTLIFAGEPRQGLVATETSIRLDPRDPLLPWHLNRVAIAHYFARNYEAAVDTARRVVRLYPDFPLIYRWLAAALGQIGRAEEAGLALNKAITICGGSFDMYVRERVPWHRAEDYEHMLDGLRKAGWRG